MEIIIVIIYYVLPIQKMLNLCSHVAYTCVYSTNIRYYTGFHAHFDVDGEKKPR